MPIAGKKSWPVAFVDPADIARLGLLDRLDIDELGEVCHRVLLMAFAASN
jgi:hypothetical protein